jgi:hypothetical protein
VSLFHDPAAPAIADLWKSITGSAPDKYSGNKEGQLQQQGSIGGRRYTLVSGPGRVDLFMLPPEDSEELPPNVGPHIAALEALHDVGSKVAAHVPSLIRIGLGGVMLHFTENKADAYAALERRFACLNFAKDSVDDFLLQINRPIKSAVIADLTLNRIVRWSYMPLQMVQFQLQAESGGAPTPSAAPVATLKHSVRLDIDVNTAAANATQFSKDNGVSLVKELAEATRWVVADALDAAA